MGPKRGPLSNGMLFIDYSRLQEQELFLVAIPPYGQRANLITQIPFAISTYGQVVCTRNQVGNCLEVSGIVVLLVACLVPAARILALWAVGPATGSVLIHERFLPTHEDFRVVVEAAHVEPHLGGEEHGKLFLSHDFGHCDVAGTTNRVVQVVVDVGLFWGDSEMD